MHTKLLKLQIAGLLLAWATVACTPSHNSTPTSAPQTPEGSSSGGGGFVDENSTQILQKAAKDLAHMIRYASPEIFATLPKGWGQERLASIIENVRYEPSTQRSRDGRALMFDYGTDKKGEYIVALEPFFVAYSSFPFKFSDNKTTADMLKDVKLKLAHEASHHMGLDEDRAETFAMSLLTSLFSDTMACGTTAADPAWPGAQVNAPRYDWIFHRSTGFGLVNNPITYAQAPVQPDYQVHIQAMLNGDWIKQDEVSIEMQIGQTQKCFTKITPGYIWGFDSCYGVGQRSYDLEPQQTLNGSVTYKAVNPFAASESFEVAADGTAVLKFTNADHSTGQIALQCQTHFISLQMP